jgi:hypothetical protein
MLKRKNYVCIRYPEFASEIKKSKNLLDCKCENLAGAAYDTFYIRDEELTEMLKKFRDKYLGPRRGSSP